SCILNLDNHTAPFMKLKSLLFAASLCAALSAQAVTVEIQADKPGAKINPAMWGAFFEDINFGADGGLYAEMVKNRAFEFPDPLMGWTKIIPSNARGDISVINESPWRSSQPHFLRIHSIANPVMGVSNEGFRGMGLRSGE